MTCTADTAAAGCTNDIVSTAVEATGCPKMTLKIAGMTSDAYDALSAVTDIAKTDGLTQTAVLTFADPTDADTAALVGWSTTLATDFKTTAGSW